MSTPVRLTTLGGVRCPRSVPVFDCRWPEDVTLPRTADDRTLWSSDRAAYAMGKLGSYGSSVSVSTYTDARDADVYELARQCRDMRRTVARAWVQWRRDSRFMRGRKADGGGVTYPPGWLALCNFGWSLGHSRDVYVVVDRTGGRS